MLLAHHIWQKNTNFAERVLLLHGMGGTAAIWRPMGASLEENYSVLSMDQRGHGKSRVVADREAPSYTPLAYGRDVVETLEHLQFHPTWVIGHSMGVRTACATAHLKPEWVRGMVLVDLGFSGVAGGGLGEGLARFIRKLPERFESREAARTFMNAECPDPSIAQYLMAVSTSGPDGVSFPFDHGALIETILAARDASVRGWVRELGERGMPILVLRGALSQVWSHEEFEEERTRFADLPSVVFEEFAGTGHGLPFEKRAAFVERVLSFMRGK